MLVAADASMHATMRPGDHPPLCSHHSPLWSSTLPLALTEPAVHRPHPQTAKPAQQHRLFSSHSPRQQSQHSHSPKPDIELHNVAAARPKHAAHALQHAQHVRPLVDAQVAHLDGQMCGSSSWGLGGGEAAALIICWEHEAGHKLLRQSPPLLPLLHLQPTLPCVSSQQPPALEARTMPPPSSRVQIGCSTPQQPSQPDNISC